MKHIYVHSLRKKKRDMHQNSNIERGYITTYPTYIERIIMEFYEQLNMVIHFIT